MGLVIGGAQATLWLVGASFGMPNSSLVALVLALGLWLTGGLHFDGVLDCGDGLGAGKRLLEAMADSRIGASGLAAGLVLLLIKTSALLALTAFATPAALVWCAFWGRVAPLIAINCFPYLRPAGSAGFHRQTSLGLVTELQPSAIGLCLLVAISYLIPALPLAAGLSALIPVVVVPCWLGRRLGGHSGDSYGACVEWSEALGLWCIWFSCRLLS